MAEGAIASLSRRRQILFIIAIFSGNSVVALIWDALPPILVSIARHFGGGAYGQGIAQLASSLPFLGVMIAGLVAGFAMEKVGIRRLLLATLVIFGVSGSAGLFIDTAWIFLASRFVVGFAIGTMMTCCTSLITLTFDGVMRARMNAWLLAVGCLFAVSLLLVSGYVATAFSWRAPFALHAVMAAIFLIPVLAVPDIQMRPVERGVFHNLTRLGPVYPVFFTAFALHAVVMQLLLKLPFILAQTHLGDPEKVSFVFALQASASMVSAFSYGRWAAYLRLSLVIPSGLILTSMGFVVAASATTFPVFAIAALITGSGAAISHAALFTWAMRSSPLDLAPHALGFVNTSLYLGDALSPIVFAPLFLLADLRLHLLILAAVIIAALVAVFIGRSICGSFGFGGVAKSGVTTD